MISVKHIVASLLVVAVNAQKPNYLSPVLLQPTNLATKCLTANNTNGAPVTIQSCTGGASQQWTFDGGSVKLYNNSKCLDIKDGVRTDGARLQVWDCFEGNTNQQFYYTGDYRLAWTDHGKCVDLTDGKVTDGNIMQVWTCGNGNTNQVWNTGYPFDNLPKETQDGQSGTNNCGTNSSQGAQCQTAWINDEKDFCIWGLPSANETAQHAVAYCSQSVHGTRLISNGTLQNVEFSKTSTFVQVTGTGNLTSLNIPAGNNGIAFGPHGAGGKATPIGGLVFGNSLVPNLQYHEWTSSVSDKKFCFRACAGPNAASDCTSCGQ